MIDGFPIAFLSFADSRFQPTLDRIRAEAGTVDGFDALFCWNEHDLDPDFRRRHEAFIAANSRGYGYWIWKAQCVRQALARLPDGAILLYADAGASLNPEGRPRLADYCRMLAAHPSGRLVFELEDFHHEEKWTKEHTLQSLGFTSPAERSSPQLCAGAFLIRKTPGNLAFIERHSELTQRYDLINDEAVIPNSAAFRDHRHDQSVWSILNKQQPPVILKDETYFEGAWDENRRFPVHMRRFRVTNPPPPDAPAGSKGVDSPTRPC